MPRAKKSRPKAALKRGKTLAEQLEQPGWSPNERGGPKSGDRHGGGTRGMRIRQRH